MSTIVTSIVASARRSAAVGFAAGLVAACGDLYSEPSLGPTVTAEPPTALPFRDAGTVVAKDLVTACPSSPAIEGAECGTIGATCEYGSSPDQQCNTTLSCGPDGNNFGRTWTARPSVLCPSYECPRGPSAPIEGTPCSLPAGDGGAPADADELVCPMSDALCACSTGTDPSHAHPRVWVCVKPPASCPATRPLGGQSCGEERSCDYGSCAFKRGMKMECKTGVWTSGSASCN